MGKYDDLEKIQKLKEQGAITEEEFEIEKKKILGYPPTSNSANPEVKVEVVKRKQNKKEQSKISSNIENKDKIKKDTPKKKFPVKKLLSIIIPLIVSAIFIGGLIYRYVIVENYLGEQKEAIKKFSQAIMSTSEMSKYEKYLDKKGIVAMQKAKGDTSKFRKKYRNSSGSSTEIMYNLMAIAYENEHGDIDDIEMLSIGEAVQDSKNWGIYSRKCKFVITQNKKKQTEEIKFVFYKNKLINIIINEDGSEFSMFEGI